MKKQNFKPRLEGLESRWCPAVPTGVSAVLSGTTLKITGDDGDNAVKITDDGAGNLKVTLDGGAEQSFSGVTQVHARLEDGNDTFEYVSATTTTTTTTDPATGDVTTVTTTDPAELTHALGLNLHLGDGDDTATLDFSGGVSAGPLRINLHGRDGNDSLDAKFGDVSDANVFLNLHPGKDDDSTTLEFGALTNARVHINAHQHFGNDLFNASFDGAIDGTSRVRANVHGHHGDDQYNITGTGVDIASGAIVDLKFHDHHGDETLTLDWQGKLEGALRFGAHLNHGKDTVNANFDVTGGTPDTGTGGTGGSTGGSTGGTTGTTAPVATLDIRVLGGHGNDTLAVNVLAPAAEDTGGAGGTGGTTGTTESGLKINALVAGGHGNDDLTLKIEGPSTTDPNDPNAPPVLSDAAADIVALLDGGHGHDTCVASASVTVKNCEP